MVASNLSMSAQVDKVCKSANARLFTIFNILKCNDLNVLTRDLKLAKKTLLSTCAAPNRFVCARMPITIRDSTNRPRKVPLGRRF